MKKVANYRIGALAFGENVELQTALDRCQEGYPEHGFPIFDFRAGERCMVAGHRTIGGNRSFVHLVCFEEGAGAAVVETVQQAMVGETAPPDQQEFIKLQMFFICSGRHVIFIGHNSPAR